MAGRLNVPVIINDRVDIAMAVGAAGVHLGQDDMPPAAARKILGDNAIIGFSTHNLAQACAASMLPVDYIAVGPIFPTSTKEDPEDLVGLAGLAEIRRAIGYVPLVAIGGITEQELRPVLAAGADSVAMIAAIISPCDIVSRLCRFRQLVS